MPKGKAIAALIIGGVTSLLLMTKKNGGNGGNGTTPPVQPPPTKPTNQCKIGEFGITCTSTSSVGGSLQRYCYGSKEAAEQAILDMADMGYSCFLD